MKIFLCGKTFNLDEKLSLEMKHWFKEQDTEIIRECFCELTKTLDKNVSIAIAAILNNSCLDKGCLIAHTKFHFCNCYINIFMEECGLLFDPTLYSSHCLIFFNRVNSNRSN